MKWLIGSKARKAVLAAGLLVITVLAVILAVCASSRNALEEYKRELRSAGEKLTFAELTFSETPPEKNGAEICRQVEQFLGLRGGSVLDTNRPEAMWMVAPGKAQVSWKQPFVGSGFGSNSWEEIDLAVEDRQEGLELLQQLIERPVLDFAHDYKQGGQLKTSHLLPLKRSAELLSAAALCDLHHADVASAVTNTRALLALVEGMHKDDLVIGQLVRAAMAHIAFGTTWELLHSPNVTDQQFAVLQSDWTEVNFVDVTESTLVNERAFISANVAGLRGSNSPFSSYAFDWTGGGSSGNWSGDLTEYPRLWWDGVRLKAKETAWKTSWSFSDELIALKGQQALLEAVRQIRTNGFFIEALREQQRKWAALGLTNRDERPFFASDPNDLDPRRLVSGSVFTLHRFLHRIMVAEGARQLAVTAIALKRYQLRHGNLPLDLNSLAPDFLPAVPRDPIDGQPVRYRKNADGTYLLYLVGEDGKDGGGDPTAIRGSSPSWQMGRDWVWPQAATEGEILAREEEIRSRLEE